MNDQPSTFAPEWEPIRNWRRCEDGLMAAVFADESEYVPQAAEVAVLARGQTVTLGGFHYQERGGVLHRKPVMKRTPDGDLAPAATFAPDERPPEQKMADALDGPPPFTPEQETRLRKMAWEACEAFAVARDMRLSSRALAAEGIKTAFLEGRRK